MDGVPRIKQAQHSLLAKQVWCLSTQENSLFHRVFKAKFFPHCSIMDSVSANKGSYAWKSLYQARHVIDLGAVWRVGDKKTIQIRNDRWLPKVSCPKIVSPILNLPQNARVSDLINAESYSWKADLVKQEFIPQEASLILGIPLSYKVVPDE